VNTGGTLSLDSGGGSVLFFSLVRVSSGNIAIETTAPNPAETPTPRSFACTTCPFVFLVHSHSPTFFLVHSLSSKVLHLNPAVSSRGKSETPVIGCQLVKRGKGDQCVGCVSEQRARRVFSGQLSAKRTSIAKE
jgi:hypothetical protein